MTDLMTKALGRNVLAADTATSVGKVKAFVVDQPPRTITAIHVAGRKRSPELVDWSAVTGFGPDAVMVDTETSLREAEADREEQMARHRVELLGSKILDTLGYERGEVADVGFDPETGAIDHVITGDGQTVPVAAIRALGSYALVIEA